MHIWRLGTTNVVVNRLPSALFHCIWLIFWPDRCHRYQTTCSISPLKTPKFIESYWRIKHLPILTTFNVTKSIIFLLLTFYVRVMQLIIFAWTFWAYKRGKFFVWVQVFEINHIFDQVQFNCSEVTNSGPWNHVPNKNQAWKNLLIFEKIHEIQFSDRRNSEFTA